jgi:hypothetical protein
MDLVNGHRRFVTTNDHDQSKLDRVLSCDNIFRTMYETPLKRRTPFWAPIDKGGGGNGEPRGDTVGEGLHIGRGLRLPPMEPDAPEGMTPEVPDGELLHDCSWQQAVQANTRLASPHRAGPGVGGIGRRPTIPTG